MRRWRIGLAVVAVGLLLDGCGVAHERSARYVVSDTPVGLAVGSRIALPPTTLDPDRIPDELVERRLGAVIDIVTRHPATARTIATKLARRFVSDQPLPAVGMPTVS